MAEGSPQTIVERDEQVELSPILMLLKANDKNHPLEMQERFIASYRKRGGTIEVHTFDGLPEHRMVPSPEQPQTIRAIDTITAFIRRHSGVGIVSSRGSKFFLIRVVSRIANRWPARHRLRACVNASTRLNLLRFPAEIFGREARILVNFFFDQFVDIRRSPYGDRRCSRAISDFPEAWILARFF